MATSTVSLKRWGNSQGFVLPKGICDRLGLRVGDELTLEDSHGVITVTPKRSYTLEALMEGYDGPMPEEYDWGAPMGRELW